MARSLRLSLAPFALVLWRRNVVGRAIRLPEFAPGEPGAASFAQPLASEFACATIKLLFEAQNVVQRKMILLQHDAAHLIELHTSLGIVRLRLDLLRLCRDIIAL